MWTRWRAQVPDDAEAIARALAEATQRHDLVIVTGGLGPTADDVTLEGLVGAFDLALRQDRQVQEELEARYAGRGGRPPGWAARQSRVPHGAEILANRVGTAPGFALERPEERLVVLKEDVPRLYVPVDDTPFVRVV